MQCACGSWFQYTPPPKNISTEEYYSNKLDTLCPSCKRASNPTGGYLSDHEFVQGSLTNSPIANMDN